MQDDSSIILFASNISTDQSSKPKLRQANSDSSDSQARIDIRNLFKLVAAYTNLEIIAHLREFGARMVVFHFEGSSDNWQSLRAICQHSSIGALPTYLGKQKHLRVVFLSGCADDNFIEDLLNAGVPAVVSSTVPLSIEQTELFAESVESQLNAGASLYEAIEVGKRDLQAIVGEKQRVFVNFRYTLKDMTYSSVPPHIYGEHRGDNNGTNGYQKHNESQAGGTGSRPPNPPTPNQSFENSEPSSRSPRNWKRPHPFVGNRPFSREDDDIFFGRNSEVRELAKLVKDTTTQPFILLSGAAGCGKTSLIQAGLLATLKNEFEVIELSAESIPELVSVLRNELTTRTGRENLLEAWQTLEGNYDAVKNMVERRILLIIDNIDSIINSQHPRDRREIRNLLHALLPVYAHSLFRSHSKILLSARSAEARDIWLLLREIGLPTEEIALRTISATGLAQAIRMPFVEASPGNIRLSEEVARRIEHDLLNDPHSAQLSFLQAIIESLWHATYSRLGNGATISLIEYEALYRTCRLLNSFLDTQLERIRQQLHDQVDEYSLLRILWHHCSPHHQPVQRGMKDRHLQFPQLNPQLMQETLSALCDHKLLMNVPADKPGTLQIAHSELSPLVRERLITRNNSTKSIWQRLVEFVTERYRGIRIDTSIENLYHPTASLGYLAGQSGQIHLGRADATLLLTIFALMLACLIAGFLIDRLFF